MRAKTESTIDMQFDVCLRWKMICKDKNKQVPSSITFSVQLWLKAKYWVWALTFHPNLLGT